MKEGLCVIEQPISFNLAQLGQRLYDWELLEIDQVTADQIDNLLEKNYQTMVYLLQWNNEQESSKTIAFIQQHIPDVTIVVLNPNQFPVGRIMQSGAHAVLDSDDGINELEELCLSALY